LAKITLHLGETEAINKIERSVIYALWHDGRTVKETASVLERPISEIQAMRMKFFKRLSNAVRATGRVASSEMDHRPSEAERIIESAFKTGLSGTALKDIRQKSEVILKFLDDPSSDAFFQKHAAELDPIALADIYSALGSTAPADAEDSALLESPLTVSDQDERGIGIAFCDVLLPTLPYDLKRFGDRVFLGAPPVDRRRYERLKSETSVLHGGSAAAELAQFGVTPVTIVEASQGLANLARRFCDQNNIRESGTFIMDKVGRDDGYSSKFVLPRNASVSEVQLMCELPEATSQRLFDWLTHVAEYAPAIFEGFETQLRGDELRVQRTDEVKGLFSRWSTPPTTVAA
jgi:hypothetical protein